MHVYYPWNTPRNTGSNGIYSIYTRIDSMPQKYINSKSTEYMCCICNAYTRIHEYPINASYMTYALHIRGMQYIQIYILNTLFTQVNVAHTRLILLAYTDWALRYTDRAISPMVPSLSPRSNHDSYQVWKYFVTGNPNSSSSKSCLTEVGNHNATMSRYLTKCGWGTKAQCASWRCGILVRSFGRILRGLLDDQGSYLAKQWYIIMNLIYNWKWLFTLVAGFTWLINL